MIQRKKDVMQEILMAVIEVTDSTEHDAFADFQGHIKGMSVYYYRNGWSEDKKTTWLCMAGTDVDELESVLAELLELI